MKYLILILCMWFVACKPTQKKQTPIDDSDVLRPKEGYGNPRYARSVNYVDSVKTLMLSARPVPCSQVQGLVSTTITNITVSLFWTATGAKKYNVYYNTLGSKGGTNAGQSVTNSFTVAGLLPGTTYYFSVAMIGQGNKVCDISEPIQVMTSVTPPPPPPPPPSTGDQVIFIQFNAYTDSSQTWNNDPIVSPGSGLTLDEQIASFNIVKNGLRYHPKITLTMDKAVYDAADKTHRQMTIVTTNNWYGLVGGVSYIESFNNGQPNWVFSALENYNTFYIGMAITHENGHALGLYHNVDSCSQSYGQSRICSDGVLRAPWMGGSYDNCQRYFFPEYNVTWTTTGLEKNDCKKPDENLIIENHLK